MIYFEEKDLIRRFGDKYKNYQERTGALFSKIKKIKQVLINEKIMENTQL